MGFFSTVRRRPGWLCVNVLSDHVDVAHVLVNGSGRPEALLCDSFQKEGDDAATLARLRRELDLGRYRCTTLLNPGEYQMLQVEAPNVPQQEMKNALRWRLKDLLDYPVEAATVDMLEIPLDENAPVRNRQLYAVAARNEVIAARVRLFDDAKIPLEAIDVPELAQRNIAARFEENGRGAVLLAFYPEDGLLTFSWRGELFQLRRIDLAFNQLAESGGEQRTQYYERIVLELQRSLDNFDRQYHYVPIAKVLLAPVPGCEDLAEHLAHNVDLPVETLDLGRAMSFPQIPELREPARQSQCLRMIGAALREEAAA